MAQMVRNLPAMWDTWVQPLGWEDSLQEGMATDSSILAWRIPMDRGAWWATIHGVVELDTTEQLSTHITSQFLNISITSKETAYPLAIIFLYPFPIHTSQAIANLLYKDFPLLDT